MVSGTMPSACDFRTYIKYRDHLENSAGPPMTDEDIDSAIDEAVRFFSE
jgi:hypothetical protein